MNITDLSNSILENICFYLQDRDVFAFERTSKKAAAVAKQVIENRFETLLSSYTISRTFNIKSPIEADLLLIGELHYDKECERTQAALINFWAGRGSVILILETTPLDETIAPLVFEEEAKKTFIKEAAISSGENIHILGWDNKECDKVAVSLERKARKLEANKKEQKKIYDKLIRAFEKLNCDQSVEFRKLIDNKELASDDKLIKMPLSVIEVYVLHVGFKLLEEDNNYLNFVVKTKVINLEHVMSIEVFESYFDSKEEEASFRKEYQTASIEDIHNEMPKRTESMVNTLRKIDTFISQKSLHRPKVVLIAGRSHFENSPSEKNDPRYNLESLYQQLAHHKAAILIPTKLLETVNGF